MTSYYKGLIAETDAREAIHRAAQRARDAETFCHHGRNMLEQCTACADEEDNR
jgi:hypothetical protein